MRQLALGAASAALFSLALRPWGSGYFAIAGVVCLLLALSNEMRPAKGAAIGAVAWLGLGIPTLEGVAPRLWWGLPALIGLLMISWVLFGALFVWLRRQQGELKSLASFVLLLTAAEFLVSRRWLVGEAATGLLAYTQASTPLKGVAAWSGTSAVVVLLGLIAAGFVAALGRRWHMAGGLGATVVISLLLPVPGTYVQGDHGTLRVAAVQGARPNLERLFAGYDERINEGMMSAYRALVGSAVEDGAELVVLGETVLPLRTDIAALDAATRGVLAHAPATIVGGREPAAEGLFNSAFRWNGHGVESIYRKRSLVPIIEAAFTAGESSRPAMLQGALVGLGICLDSVHSGLARAAVAEGAELLVYITDDTFAGYTTTPHAHLATAVLRAAETGRVVVFANEWGPSALIDHRGNIIEAVPLGVEGVAIAELRLAAGITPFVAVGDWLGWLATVASVALLLFAATSGPSSRSHGGIIPELRHAGSRPFSRPRRARLKEKREGKVRFL